MEIDENLDYQRTVTESESIAINLTKGAHTVKENVIAEKEKIIQQFLHVTKEIKSQEQLEVLRKTVAPLAPNLKALEILKERKPSLIDKNKAPHNKKIVTQRRLYSTKKTRRAPKKNSLKRPIFRESIDITVSLLDNKINSSQ